MDPLDSNPKVLADEKSSDTVAQYDLAKSYFADIPLVRSPKNILQYQRAGIEELLLDSHI